MHTHTHTHTCTYVYTYTHTCTCTHTHACTHTYTHTCTHIHMYTHIRTHIRTHTHAHAYVHAHAHTCTHTHAHAYVHTHMHTHVHTHTYLHIHTCTHIHTYTYVHIHVNTGQWHAHLFACQVRHSMQYHATHTHTCLLLYILLALVRRVYNVCVCASVRVERRMIKENFVYRYWLSCIMCSVYNKWATWNVLLSIHNRGDSLTVQQGKVTASAWKDRKVVTVVLTTTRPTAAGIVLRRQRMDPGFQCHVLKPSSPTMSLWEGWIEAISSEAITAAAQRGESSTNISSTFCLMSPSPMRLCYISTTLPPQSTRPFEIFVCSWQRSPLAITTVVRGLVGGGPFWRIYHFAIFQWSWYQTIPPVTINTSVPDV